MNAALQTLFQYLSDPNDLADSVSAFIQSRSEKLKPTLEAVSKVIDGSLDYEDFIADSSVYHKWSLSLLDDEENGRYINLNDVVTAIDHSIEQSDGDPNIAVNDFGGGTVDEIPLSEALDRMYSLTGETEMLTTALNIAQQVADGDTDEFLQNSLAKVDGYLGATSLSDRLKGIFTTIYEEIRENIADPVYLVESILVHFGIIGNNDDPRRNDITEYTGQSARCVLFMDAAEKLGWSIAHLPDAYFYTLGFSAAILNGLRTLIELSYKGIQKLTYKAIGGLFELGDGIQKTALPGRGFIKHPGFAIEFDGSHTSFPTGEELAGIYDSLGIAIGDAASRQQQYTVPIGPVAIYVDWAVNSARLTYDIKPVNYQLYKQVYYEHFGAFPYLSIKSVGGSILADSTGEKLEGKTRLQLLNFIKDLYSRDNIWGMDYEFDSDRYMCIQAAKHLCSIIYVLSDTSVEVVSSALSTDCNDACIFIDITTEHGYRADTQSFIPENINFASLCTMIGKRSSRVDCFYSYLNDSNILDFTDNSIISQISSINCDFMVVLGKLASAVIGNDPLSTTQFFIPYFHKFKLYSPSYYIPTDTNNVTALKRMIVVGLTVIAVIATVAIVCTISAKFKKRKWVMEQQAAQKAFTASERGDASMLQESWKIQKRVNLLGALSGAATVANTPITNGVTTAIQAVKGGASVVQDGPTLQSIQKSISG